MIEMRYIPIRVCSKKKSRFIKNGTLDQIYTEHMLQAFFKRFSDYCVLSRKLGICHAGKIYENYHDYQEKSPGELLVLLREQSKDYRDVVFLYWNHRPLTHSGFVRLLRDAGFNVLEFRKLDEITRFLLDQEARQPVAADYVDTRSMKRLDSFAG
jgi:hypothetical protein